MRRALLIAALLPALGCATSSAFRDGEKAERLQDYDRAVLEYSRAVKENPNNVQYARALGRARLRASTEHANMGRRLAGRGLYKDALDEYRLALDLNPQAVHIQQEMEDLEARREAGRRAASLEDIKAKARESSLPGLDLGSDADEPLGLVFREASLREAYLALARAAGVNVVFDPDFRDQPVSLDLQDVPFEQALSALNSAGHTFHRVTDSRIITVIPDTQAKRREYEQQVIKTLFLSNADVKETIDLLRVVLGARRVAPLPGANALTINDTPDKIAAAERIVEIVDKRRAEVVVEVEILEIKRNRLKEYGIYLTSGLDAQGIEGIATAIIPNPREDFTLDDNPYSASNLVVTALPGAVVRLLQSDSSTRLLANPQLRISEGQTAQARFGDQVPVPVTIFASIATGGIAQQPITSFEYKNVGVNIDITPRVHHDGEVTLELKLDISAVGPAGYQGLPTFSTREVDLDNPPGRRRDQPPRRPDPRRRAARPHRDSRGGRHPLHRSSVRSEPGGGGSDGHRHDADAPRPAPPRDDRRGPALVPGRGRSLPAALRRSPAAAHAGPRPGRGDGACGPSSHRADPAPGARSADGPAARRRGLKKPWSLEGFRRARVLRSSPP